MISPLAGANSSAAADFVVISTTAAKEALHELVPLFQRASGHTVAMTYGSGLDIVGKVRNGLAGDLFIGPEEFTDALLAESKLVAGSRVAFARSGAGVAVRAGAPKPDISTPEAFKAALIAAKSVSFSRGASGIKLVRTLERIGIGAEIAKKKIEPLPGELVGAVVARGAAEIGIQQLSELLPVADIDILGPLPGDLQDINIYGISLLPGCKQPETAQEFVRFLRSDQAAAIIRRKGMDPV